MKKIITIALAGALTLAIVGPAVAKKKKPKTPPAPTAVELQFFMRRADCGAADDFTHLSMTDADDVDCPGGDAMLYDVYNESGLIRPANVYPAIDGVPFTLDSTRKVSGSISIGGALTPGQLYGVGAGNVEVDIDLLASVGGGELSSLGTASGSFIQLPGQTTQFTYEIELDPALAGQAVSELALDVFIHGAGAGFPGMVVHDEKSILKVPALK